MQLFNNEIESKDFILESKDPSVQFKAHLFLLVARSDFFGSLAESSMIESKNMKSQIQLNNMLGNVQSSTFEIFLKYLYYGSLPTANF